MNDNTVPTIATILFFCLIGFEVFSLKSCRDDIERCRKVCYPNEVSTIHENSCICDITKVVK